MSSADKLSIGIFLGMLLQDELMEPKILPENTEVWSNHGIETPAAFN
jgi:hypothetical protein